MAHKVFVCYSSKDQAVANAACAALEAHNILCWIAPRNVPAGEEYAASIIEALEETEIVVLIFSLHADNSRQVRKEIERAASKDKIILPFRIETFTPSRAMEYELSNRQWLDAMVPPMEDRLSELCVAVERLLQRRLVHDPLARADRSPTEFREGVQAVPKIPSGSQSRGAKLWGFVHSTHWTAAIAVLILGVLIWSGYLWWRDHQLYQPNSDAEQWFNEGVKSLQEGNYSKATRSLDAAIDKDPQFAMAHARLAEAWLDLDFQNNAQREMLLAARGEDRLSSLNHLYYKAIEAGVTEDFAAAAAVYRKILGDLDGNAKSNGYVDLGWAEERAQEPALALKYYTKALSLNSLNAAAAVHIGVLQSRFGHVTEANHAFQQAQDIFDKASNLEGMAELDFERGYAANDRRDAKDARVYLQKAQEEAKPLNDIQLNIRILAQLSGATNRFSPEQAAQYAQDAIAAARLNGLQTWAAEGLVRLAAAQLFEGHPSDAEDSVLQGKQIAMESQQLRAEAMANLIIASIENAEHHPDQVIGPAQAALAFYQKNGFFTEGVSASLLLARAARDQGRFNDVLASATTAKKLATQAGNNELMRQAEELFGTTLEDEENYPEALIHFQKARALADSPRLAQYEELDYDDVLWRLGRFADFQQQMNTFKPVTPDLASWADTERVSALLSQGKYADSLALAKSAVSDDKSGAADRDTFTTDETLAESHLGMRKDALAGLAVLAAKAKADSPPDAAGDYLVIAEVSLNLGLAPQAEVAATTAAADFKAGIELDSTLRSSLLGAVAARLANDPAAASNFSKKALDTQSLIEHNWGPAVSQVYFSRPDLHSLLQLLHF